MQNENSAVVKIWLFWNFRAATAHRLFAEHPIFADLLFVFALQIIAKCCHNLGTGPGRQRIKDKNAGPEKIKLQKVSKILELGPS